MVKLFFFAGQFVIFIGIISGYELFDTFLFCFWEVGTQKTAVLALFF